METDKNCIGIKWLQLNQFACNLNLKSEKEKTFLSDRKFYLWKMQFGIVERK